MPKRSEIRGATLVEAVVAILVLGLAVPPLVTLFVAAADQGAEQTYQASALDLADGLMEEIAARAFEDPDLAPGSFGREEATRALYDDVDDYDGLSDAPPLRWDGTVLADDSGFVLSATVDNVPPSEIDPPVPAGDGTSPLKRVRVSASWTIGRGGRVTLTTLRTRIDRSGGALRERP